MKAKIFITTIILILFCLPRSTAQIGIKGGASISDIAFKKNGQTPYLGYEINSLEHRKPKLTFQAGAFSTFELGNRFDFQPELLFAVQGLDYGTKYLYDDITYKINISYLHFPLLLKYTTAIKNNRQSGLLAGPYFSWKLKAVRVLEIEGQKEEFKVSNIKDIDLGIVAGFSMDFDLPSGQMVVDLRSSYSLINMMKRLEGYVPSYYGPSKEYVRNVNISLTVGYRFLNIWPKKSEKQ